MENHEPATAYRTKSVNVYDRKSAAFWQVPPDAFGAIEAVPEFAARWAWISSLQNDARKLLTATVNSSGACPIGARSLCGQYCFAHRSWSNTTSPRRDAAARYAQDARRLEEEGRQVGIFMSYDTEPFPGGEICRISRDLLKAMIEHPPGALLVHSHTANIGHPEVVDLLADLSQATDVIAGIGFETDSDDVGANRPHHHAVQERFEALEKLSSRGVKTQASTTPLMGFLDYGKFVRRFKEAGTYRVMIGELRKEFAGGGTEHAKGVDIGLPAPSEEEARATCEELGFPGGVDVRESFYVTMS